MYSETPPATPEVDQEMFLRDFNAWSKPWATQLARQLGYEGLSPDQWKIIHALRDHYRRHGAIPNPHSICKTCGLEHFCLDKYFNNDGKQAWKIAGLPNPGEEVKVYL